MNDRVDTLVVGGGAIGLSIAWELARRGRSVTLLERNDAVGRATSWTAGGILPPANLDLATDPVDRLRGLSHQLMPQWVDQLHQSTGINTGYRRCGGWYLADTLGERASMIGMVDYWRSLSIQCDPISLPELNEREPNICLDRLPELSAWWVPDECQIRSPDYLRALHQACLQQGVSVVTGATVNDLRWGPQATSPDTAAAFCNGRWYDADQIVLCGGAWTGQLSPQLRLETSLVPIRGQMLMLKTDAPLLRPVLNVGHRYIVSREDGVTLVGSCEEEVGFREGTTDQVIDSLHQFACQWIPALGGATRAQRWCGFRPMTFDGFPIIGRLPDTRNVFVATGHYRSGIHLSPGTAVSLADLMEGHTPLVDMEPFRVGKQQSNHTAQSTPPL